MEEDGQNCGKKNMRDRWDRKLSQSTKTDHEWGGCLGMGNDRLEEEDDGVDEEDGESELSIGGIGSRLGDLGRLRVWEDSTREDADREAQP